MNDSKLEIGSNWGSGTPRTMREAFPHTSIGGEWGRAQAVKEAERVQHRDDALVLLVLVLCFVGGLILSPFIDVLLHGGLDALLLQGPF